MPLKLGQAIVGPDSIANGVIFRLFKGPDVLAKLTGIVQNHLADSKNTSSDDYINIEKTNGIKVVGGFAQAHTMLRMMIDKDTGGGGPPPPPPPPPPTHDCENSTPGGFGVYTKISGNVGELFPPFEEKTEFFPYDGLSVLDLDLVSNTLISPLISYYGFDPVFIRFHLKLEPQTYSDDLRYSLCARTSVKITASFPYYSNGDSGGFIQFPTEDFVSLPGQYQDQVGGADCCAFRGRVGGDAGGALAGFWRAVKISTVDRFVILDQNLVFAVG